MATKNLARTVIEGGRSPGYKSFCRDAKRRERRRVREYCETFREFLHDPEICEELSYKLPPQLEPLSYYATDPKQLDKLAVLPYWLYRHVGERWDDVHSFVRKRFDQRTIKGKHLLFDHLLPSVSTTKDFYPQSHQFKRFEVDADGILQITEYGVKVLFHNKRSRGKIAKSPPNWPKDQLVIDYGATQFWTEIVPQIFSGMPSTSFCRCPSLPDKGYGYCHVLVREQRLCREALPLKQTRELTAKERAYWARLTPYMRDLLTFKKVLVG